MLLNSLAEQGKMVYEYKRTPPVKRQYIILYILYT